LQAGRRSEYEEKLLGDLLDRYRTDGIIIYGQVEGVADTYAKILVKSDGTVKVEGVTTISGQMDVSDRWARQLGQVDIARYLGSVIGVANPLHSQMVYGGAVIDPRSIRSLVSTDIITAYGSQTQALLQRGSTYDLYVQLRNAGVEIDPRSIRALTSSDVLTVQDIQKTVTVPTSLGGGYLPETTIPGGSSATITNAPGAGYKLRLKKLQASVDAQTRIDIRWGSTAFESYYLPANGSFIINKVGENFDGPENTGLTIGSSVNARVTASASTETLPV